MGRYRRLLCAVVAAVGLAVAKAGGGIAASSVRQVPPGLDACVRSQVRLSIVRAQNGFTGGTYADYLDLRNVGKRECSVEGHPIVVVGELAFPVWIGDVAGFDRNDPYLGPERVLHVQPGHSVRAQIVIGHMCRAASDETHGTIRLFASGRSVALQVPACRKSGVGIDTGPFLPTG